MISTVEEKKYKTIGEVAKILNLTNPKTKETKVISERNVILFRPSKELKKCINKNG